MRLDKLLRAEPTLVGFQPVRTVPTHVSFDPVSLIPQQYEQPSEQRMSIRKTIQMPIVPDADDSMVF